jgi:hypothetical protein
MENVWLFFLNYKGYFLYNPVYLIGKLGRIKVINDISLPLLDSRTADQILGYDEHGLPT